MKSCYSCHSFKIQGCDKVHCGNLVTMFVQPCDNLVTTLRQFQNTRLCQGCHKVALWQPCDNVRTTLSSQGCAKVVKKHCGNLVPRLCQGCDNLVISVWVVKHCIYRFGLTFTHDCEGSFAASWVRDLPFSFARGSSAKSMYWSASIFSTTF